jgi:hypothetical protein
MPAIGVSRCKLSRGGAGNSCGLPHACGTVCACKRIAARRKCALQGWPAPSMIRVKRVLQIHPFPSFVGWCDVKGGSSLTSHQPTLR